MKVIINESQAKRLVEHFMNGVHGRGSAASTTRLFRKEFGDRTNQSIGVNGGVDKNTVLAHIRATIENKAPRNLSDIRGYSKDALNALVDYSMHSPLMPFERSIMFTDCICKSRTYDEANTRILTKYSQYRSQMYR